MTTTIKLAMIKYVNSRSTQYTYKAIKSVLEQLEWVTTKDFGIVIQFQKSFPSDQEAIQGRKALDYKFRLVHKNVPLSYRVVSIERTPNAQT